MKLYIDTSKREEVTIALDNKKITKKAKIGSSQELLPLIQKVLKENKKTAKDIKEIVVETGPGSFTGLRVGVAVANALSFALKIPVNGKKTETVINY